jgi:hypothetical protein
MIYLNFEKHFLMVDGWDFYGKEYDAFEFSIFCLLIDTTFTDWHNIHKE